MFAAPNARARSATRWTAITANLPGTVAWAPPQSRRTTRLAWQGGLGFEWPFGSTAVSVEARLQSVAPPLVGGASRSHPIAMRVSV